MSAPDSPASDSAATPLTADDLTARLRGTRWRVVEVIDATGSTNADLIERATEQGAAAVDGVVRVTQDQTQGRGRHTRTWTAPRGSAVAISAAVAVGEHTQRLGWLSLLAGVAVANGVERVVGAAGRADAVTVGLKWPNDVLVDVTGTDGASSKVCGILSEYARVDGGGVAVIGIGINTDMTAEQLPVPTATSVGIVTGATVDAALLTEQVLASLSDLLAHWPDDIDAVIDAYRERSDTIGREVALILPDASEVRGTAVGVDPDGRIVIEKSDGERVVAAAGDVTHLRAQ